MNTEPLVLAGRYRVGRLLGHGGMAEVYLAEDTRLHRTVAVKILRSDLARDATFQERFRREAQSAGGLNHPSIVSVYDTGEDVTTDAAGTETRIPYIVMEYVEGRTLREYIDPEHPMEAPQAVRITTALLSALEFSHDAGIVHRDIKPGNIMITSTGAVKVMDFGIARAVADAASAMTQTQAVMGTAQYLSPEQARGQLVDNRTDVYSAACVLYEMLTGRPPFTGDSPVSIAYQHVRELPQAPSVFNPAVTPAMDEVILTALAKDREERYPSASDFARDLQSVITGREPELVTGATTVLGADAETTTVLSAADMPTEAISAARTTGRHAALPVGGVVGATGAQEVATDEEEKHRRPVWLFVLVAIAILAVIGAGLAILQPWRSSAPEQVAVPALAGLTQTKASSDLSDLGLTPKFSEEASSTVDEGLVISSDPTEGTSVDVGSTVQVKVSSGPADTSVPDLSGLDQAAAEKALTAAGLEPSYQGTKDATESTVDVASGTVIESSPSSGANATGGQEVQFWVASGNVAVPNVTSQTEEDATTKLEGMKFEVKVTEQASSEVAAGTVISQDPVASESAQIGSTVTIWVSTGQGQVSVPNVTGDTLANAQDRLVDENFGIGTITYEASDTVAEGRVIRTDPAANESVDPGATIAIVVSTGPAASTPTESPSTQTTDPTTTTAPTTTTPSESPTTTTPPADPTTTQDSGDGDAGGGGDDQGNAAGGRG